MSLSLPKLTSKLRHPWRTPWSSRRSAWRASWLARPWSLRGTILETEPWRWRTILSRLPASVPHHLGVDGTGDTVVELGVQLGKLVACVDACLRYVSHCSSFNNVPDDELANGLTLGHAL